MPRVTYGTPGYFDALAEAEAKHQQRAYFRRRMLAAIRGWLRENSAPRWTVAGLLLLCAAGAAGAGIVLSRCGFTGVGIISSLAVLAVWPLFLLLLRWRAEVESRRLDIGERASLFIARDEAEIAMENAPSSPQENEKWEGVRIGIQSGMQQSSGAGGFALPILILLASLTAGTWLLWDLIRLAPFLLGEAVLDGVLATRHPQLTKNIPTPPWWGSAFAATAVHFIGLALAALIFAGTLAMLLRIQL
jgi:hypothetical protein